MSAIWQAFLLFSIYSTDQISVFSPFTEHHPPQCQGSATIDVGAALRCKTLKSSKVAIAFSGEGASNQGTVFEAMNLAAALKVTANFIFEYKN